MGGWSLYTTAEGRKNVTTYKYHGTDKSLIANYIMQPFWRQAVNLLPMWMAPNLVTLIGFGAVILSFLITAFYHPDVRGAAPSWVYYLNAAAMFFYQTMDALDGKQARRTDTSSPLGELFDHGCDAVTTVLQTLTLACTLQMGSNDFLFAVMIIHMATFFLAQWEEFHTGEMILGYIGVTEAQLFSIGIYALSGAIGVDFWNNYLHFTVASFNISLRYGDFPCIVSVVSTLFLAVSSLFNIAQRYAKNQKEFNRAATQLVPVAGLSLAFILWKILSPSGIYHLMPEAFLATYGFLVANLVGRIVVARVSKQELSTFQVILVPLVAIPFVILGGTLNEELFVAFYCLISIGAYLHFAMGIIGDLCKTLKIKCLTIPTKKY